MTRFATLAAFVAPVTAAVLGLAAAPAAAADGGIYNCAPNTPEGQILTCVPLPEGTTVRQGGAPVEQADDAEAPIGEQLVPTAAPPPVYAPVPPPPPPGGYPLPVPADRPLSDRTHNWLVPTGNLVPKGDAQVTLHEFVYLDAAIGLTDNVELNFTTPIVPAFASAGVRIGLTPRSSPLRLVVGGSVWFPLFAEDSADVLFSGTATVAYQTERMNLHGSLSFLGEGGGDDGEGVGVTNVGVTFKLGRKQAIFAEYVQVIAGDESQADRVAMTGVGLKFMGATTDVDVGFVVPHELADDEGFVALPLISINYKF